METSTDFSLQVTTPAGNTSCSIRERLFEQPLIQGVIVAFYVLIFSVAVCGNFLVVYVVIRNKKMHTVTNLFITNLALSDLLVNFTSLWLTPTYMFVGNWLWGELLCRGLPLFQGMSIFISILTLMAIAVDRYLVIVHYSQSVNIHDHMSMKRCVFIIVLIWSCSLGLVIPYAVHMKVHYQARCNRHICYELWENPTLKTIYGTCVIILQFVVPFVIIGVSYRKIWTFLQNRRWASDRTVETRRRKRLLSMLVIMVVLFAFCWFPMNTLNILRDLGTNIRNFSFYFLIGHIIAMTATCWNPILYAWMNESFREEFIRAIPILRNKYKNAARVKMISECQPASYRVNCLDAPSVTGRSSSIARPFDTVLMNNEAHVNEDNPETTLL